MLATSEGGALGERQDGLMQDSMGFNPEASSSSISLREYGDVLRRRRAIILQTFVIVLVAGVLVTLFTAPTYRASARLLVEPPQYVINQVNGSDPLADLFRINQQYSIATQIQLLQTPEIQKKVSEAIGGGLPSMSIGSVDGTSIIEVVAEGDNPEMVAQAPNKLLEIYEQTVASESGGKLKTALKFAQDKADGYRSLLDRTENKLREFKKKHRVVELEANRNEQITLVNNLAAQYNSALTQNEILQTRVKAIQDAMNTKVTATKEGELLSIIQDPRIASLDDELFTLNQSRDAIVRTKDLKLVPLKELENLEARIEELSKRRAALAKNFDQRNERRNPAHASFADELVKSTIEAAILAKQTALMGKQLRDAQARLNNFPNWEAEYALLQRQRGDAENSWKAFSNNLANLELRKETTSSTATVMTRASVPTSPIRPKKAQNIVFAGILGLFFGLCLALLQELFDDRINSPEEAERVLRLPSLGHVPMIEEEGLRLIKDISTFSPLMESYRSLRTNINFAAVGTPVRSIVVTSSVPAEGKSTTVANLAMAMALDNKRVIIVDADLRRPSQHKLFKIDSSPGLTDILVGTHDLEEVIRPSSVPGVSAIPAGSPPPNPAELLGSAAMGQLLAKLESIADIVLFDSPPALAVADSVVLSARTGGVLLVIGYGETKKTNTKKALDILFRANANVLGTVLNRMDGPSSGYYYGKYYVPATTDRGSSAGSNGNSASSSATAALPENGSNTSEGAAVALPSAGEATNPKE